VGKSTSQIKVFLIKALYQDYFIGKWFWLKKVSISRIINLYIASSITNGQYLLILFLNKASGFIFDDAFLSFIQITVQHQVKVSCRNKKMIPTGYYKTTFLLKGKNNAGAK